MEKSGNNWLKKNERRVVPIAMQSFSQGIPNDPSFPIAFIAQQAVDPVERIKIQCEDQGYALVEREEGEDTSTVYPLQQQGVPPPKGKSSHFGYPQISQGHTQNTVNDNQNAPEPSCTPNPNFSAKEDSELIQKAMKGKGIDEETIINIITQRSNEQRLEIAKVFQNTYGKDLIESLESEMSGDYKESNIIRTMFKHQAYYDALLLNQAMHGGDTNETILSEVLCTRTLDEIKEIKSFYKANYLRTLEEDIMVATKGTFRDLLVTLCQKKLTDEDLDKIRKNASKEDNKGQQDLVECARFQLEYFAHKLHTALTGSLKDDETVIRIFVSRSEVDLRSIEKTFLRAYKNKLGRIVANNIKRDYKRLLLSMIG